MGGKGRRKRKIYQRQSIRVVGNEKKNNGRETRGKGEQVMATRKGQGEHKQGTRV